MDKSKECPEYDGANAIRVEELFWKWVATKEWKPILTAYRKQNIEYWTVKQAQSLADFLEAQGDRNLLASFMSMWNEWVGELPVKKQTARKPKPTGRRSITLDCGDGTTISIKVQYARSHPAADDRKNGLFYRDRQLIGLHLDRKGK